jgi:dTDP-4-dehydrorhamnose 3,5-epimerase
VIFNPTPLSGAFTIELEKRGDHRGFFARFFCAREFTAHKLETNIVQINNSLTQTKGTLRGMHYQLPPAAEVKVVRCVRGRLYDVIADLRPDSPTYRQSFGHELSAENRTMMYVPRGFAHGFITLEDDSEALYLVSAEYAPEAERGFRWDDPAFSIVLPAAVTEISAKDRSWPDFDEAVHGVAELRGIL